jgi:hypothetical protein
MLHGFIAVIGYEEKSLEANISFPIICKHKNHPATLTFVQFGGHNKSIPPYGG